MKLLKATSKTYNQDLVGDGLGNSHVDLPPLCENNEVHGIESYFLGKTHA